MARIEVVFTYTARFGQVIESQHPDDALAKVKDLYQFRMDALEDEMARLTEISVKVVD